MNKSAIISGSLVGLWLLVTTALLIAKIFGADFSWWLGTIGLWVPFSLLLSFAVLGASSLALLELVRIFAGHYNINIK